MQGLNDIWRNLFRRAPNSPDERQQYQAIDADERQERAEEIETQFHNLYWTRLISLQYEIDENYERWPLVPDINESLTALQDNEPDPDQDHHILFDPAEFIRNNPVPIRREFELDGDTLQDLAIKGT